MGAQAKGRIRPFKAKNLNHYKTQDDLGEDGILGSTLRKRIEKGKVVSKFSGINYETEDGPSR
jgi:hypothetical protein